MNAIYTIPAGNRDALAGRIEKLNRRAAKLGVQPIGLSFAHSHLQHGYGENCWAESLDTIPRGTTPNGRVREFLAVTVDGEAPKFAGWALVGVLSPLETDEGAENVIRAVPGESVPAEYRARVGQCDHCRTRRKRTETFVVRHEDDSTKMIGRQCLKDFLGHADPHSLAQWAELLCSLDGLCRDAESDEWLGGGCRQPDCWNLERFLQITAAVIRHDGWLSRTKARELSDRDMRPRSSTSDLVVSYLCPTKPAYRSREEQQWLDEISSLLAEPQFTEQAEAATEWALSLADTNGDDYLYNLNLIARAGYVTTKTIGLAASIITAYRRANDLDTEGRKKAERPISQYVGTLKKRCTMTVTCERIHEMSGMYGVTGIHRLRDQDGNLLVWFASESSEWLDEGETYTVKATPVSHEEYKDEQQTKVSRVAVVKK